MKIERRKNFTNDIVVIDGLWGTGKSLISPIVSSMHRVEKVKIEHIYEYTSVLHSLDKLSKDAALWMLKTYADLSQYHNSIGREVNLRWSDDSGLKYAPNKFKAIRRLFVKDGDKKAEEINQHNIAFCFMSHMLMLTPEMIAEAYGSRVKVVEIVRHPLYMVEHFEAYLSRYDSDREFTISYYHGENSKVPWFMKEWEDRYASSSVLEKAILSINTLYPWLDKAIASSEESGLSLLVLSFEECVFDTHNVLTKLEQFIGRKHSQSISQILRNQKLPRDVILKGRGHTRYGWKKDTGQSEKQVYQSIMRRVKNNCSEDLATSFEKTIDWYNSKYPSKLADLR